MTAPQRMKSQKSKSLKNQLGNDGARLPVYGLHLFSGDISCSHRSYPWVVVFLLTVMVVQSAGKPPTYSELSQQRQNKAQENHKFMEGCLDNQTQAPPTVSGNQGLSEVQQKMDRPPQEAPDGSLNHENTDNGSEHAGVGSSEQTGGKAPSQTANAGSGQTDQRPPEEASQLTDHRRTSQQADRRSSSQTERRTSEPPNQQLPSLLEGKASEKIDDRVSLPSGGKAPEKTDQGPLEHDEQTSPDQADYKTSGKSQRQVYNQDNFLDEDDIDQHRFSEDNNRISHETEKQADYHSFYKTLAQAEKGSLSNIGDNKEIKEADFKIQPCTFEDSQMDIRSKVSTGEETESATTIQAYNLPDTEFTSDSQSSYEKLPSITTKVYYTSSQDKFQTTEITTVGKRDI